MAKGAYIGVPTRTNPLGQFDIGSIVSLKVGGVPTDFIVVHQGNPDSNLYDASCDGTWLLMKDIYTNRAWSSSDVGYQNSTIHSYLNNEFLGLFDSDVQSAIKQVKIPYYSGASAVGSVYSGSNGLSAKVFLLGGLELGFDKSGYQYLPDDGVALSYFSGLSYMDAKRAANYQGSPAIWWLRSRKTTAQYRPLMVTASGGHNDKAYSTSYGIRPAIILPSNFGVGDIADVARKIKKPYIGVGGVARKVKKIYIGVNGVAKLCWSGGNPISSRAVGSSVYMNVNGVRTEFLVIQQGNPDSSYYDASCDGTWLLMKDIYTTGKWSASNYSFSPLGESIIHSYLNNDYLNLLDEGIRTQIKTVKIPYSTSTSTVVSGANGMPTQIFPLSVCEVGYSQYGTNYIADGKPLTYFTTGTNNEKKAKRIGYYNGTATNWWARTVDSSRSGWYWFINTTGTIENTGGTNTFGIRAAMIFPSDTLLDDNGNILA